MDMIHQKLNIFKIFMVCPKFHIIIFGTIIELCHKFIQRVRVLSRSVMSGSLRPHGL